MKYMEKLLSPEGDAVPKMSGRAAPIHNGNNSAAIRIGWWSASFPKGATQCRGVINVKRSTVDQKPTGIWIFVNVVIDCQMLLRGSSRPYLPRIRTERASNASS